MNASGSSSNLVGPADTASTLSTPSISLSRNTLIQQQASDTQPRHRHVHPYPHILPHPVLGRPAETPSSLLAGMVAGHPYHQAEQQEVAEGLGSITGVGNGVGREVHVGLHELMALAQVREAGAGAGAGARPSSWLGYSTEVIKCCTLLAATGFPMAGSYHAAVHQGGRPATCAGEEETGGGMGAPCGRGGARWMAPCEAGVRSLRGGRSP